MSFSISNPFQSDFSLATRPDLASPFLTGVMTQGTAQVTLQDKGTTSSIIEPTDLLSVSNILPGSKVGVNGKDGVDGKSGIDGVDGKNGRDGPKVLLWSQDLDLPEDEPTTILTFPHDNTTHTLESLTVIAKGEGMINISVKEVSTEKIIASTDEELSGETSVFQIPDYIEETADGLTGLFVEGTASEVSSPICVAAIEIVMQPKN